jgi:hypothetical protein
MAIWPVHSPIVCEPVGRPIVLTFKSKASTARGAVDDRQVRVSN